MFVECVKHDLSLSTINTSIFLMLSTSILVMLTSTSGVKNDDQTMISDEVVFYVLKL